MSEVVENHARFDGDPSTATVHFVMGYAAVALWSIAVERLLARGQQVTRESLAEEFEAFADVNTGRLLAPVSYSAEDHRPCTQGHVFHLDREGIFRQVMAFQVERLSTWLGY